MFVSATFTSRQFRFRSSFFSQQLVQVRRPERPRNVRERRQDLGRIRFILRREVSHAGSLLPLMT